MNEENKTIRAGTDTYSFAISLRIQCLRFHIFAFGSYGFAHGSNKTSGIIAPVLTEQDKVHLFITI